MMHIAAFVIGPIFTILFPWAWADLNQFLNMDHAKYPPWLRQNSLSPYNLLKEMQSLGEALAFLHESLRSWEYGPRSLFHMDFKSDNILVVSPSESQVGEHPIGLWKISDFGLSDFGITNPSAEVHFTMIGDVVQSIQSSGSRPTRQVGPFQAPEAERPSPYGIDQAKADVWSVGCVTVELLAFSALGPQGLKRLRQCLQRREPDPDSSRRNGYFYRYTTAHTAELVPGLSDFLTNPCGADHPSNSWFARMWRYTSENAMSIDPARRPKAGEFCEELRRLVQTLRTPRECLFEHAQLPGEAITPTSSASGQVPEHLSAPTMRTEQLATVHQSRRSSSSPPQHEMGAASGRSAGLRLRIGSGTSPRETTRYSSSSSPRSLALRGLPSTPRTPRQSGSISTLDSSPLQQSTTWPPPPADSSVSINFSEQLKSHKLECQFVALSAHGTAILFSDTKRIVWSQIPGNFATPFLRDCDLGSGLRFGRNSVHPSVLSFLIKKDNKHVALQSMSGGTFISPPRSLDHLTMDREIKAICISSAQYQALEFTEDIEVFDANGRVILEHSKHRRDSILDLAFDQDAEYFFGISRDRYWAWQFAGRSNEFLPLQYDDVDVTSLMKGIQKPKIITIRGSANFFIQEAEPADGNMKLILVDKSGPRKEILKLEKGSIVSPMCLTLDNRELFALVLPHDRKRQHLYSLQQWAVTVEPRLAIELRPLPDPRPEISINKTIVATPGRMSIAPFQVDHRNFALVAQHDGLVHRLPIDSFQT